MKPRIMYIECKTALAGGEARIGRVTFSKTGQTIYYRGRTFHKIPGGGCKSNYYDETSKEAHWISGPRKDGKDRLYGERIAVEVDEDVRAEYWILIRKLPDEKERETA